ncbi:flavoprotein [Staphylothermus hellenicus]|uniref:Flavoprotein n=1 Tax=Staphylothermus hellenicus (strain DSM 12710 / JCM 10830 / BK20S6-10-b1 / P8) TaxID=591019 RepID=D7D9L6_STAHD|nr:flavoprotein [Staphylothermus hellenicus]ADI32462.1 flavoprotein [Staphylothermus hellenicus DSM 12710]
MDKRVVWCITGSGSFLREIYDLFVKLREKHGIVIAVAFSDAGVEVARIYGILDQIDKIVSKNTPYSGVYFSRDSASGIPLAGRISFKRYDLVVVAPSTSNTVAKIVHGIADTLPTIIVSQSLKAGIPVIIFPSDYSARSLTTLPCRIDLDKCIYCMKCLLEEGFCPYNAIVASSCKYGIHLSIDYSKCRGCEVCVNKCPVKAIKCWEKATITPSTIDLRNLEKLATINGVTVVTSLKELEKAIYKKLSINVKT